MASSDKHKKLEESLVNNMTMGGVSGGMVAMKTHESLKPQLKKVEEAEQMIRTHFPDPAKMPPAIAKQLSKVTKVKALLRYVVPGGLISSGIGLGALYGLGSHKVKESYEEFKQHHKKAEEVEQTRLAPMIAGGAVGATAGAILGTVTHKLLHGKTPKQWINRAAKLPGAKAGQEQYRTYMQRQHGSATAGYLLGIPAGISYGAYLAHGENQMAKKHEKNEDKKEKKFSKKAEAVLIKAGALSAAVSAIKAIKRPGAAKALAPLAKPNFMGRASGSTFGANVKANPGEFAGAMGRLGKGLSGVSGDASASLGKAFANKPGSAQNYLGNVGMVRLGSFDKEAISTRTLTGAAIASTDKLKSIVRQPIRRNKALRAQQFAEFRKTRAMTNEAKRLTALKEYALNRPYKEKGRAAYGVTSGGKGSADLHSIFNKEERKQLLAKGQVKKW